MPPTRSSKGRKAKFDAFTVATTTKNGKTKNQTIAREEGIHSQSWLLAIVPQRQIGFLLLPLELRQKIYRYGLTWMNKLITITPVKKGQKFGNDGWNYDPEKLSPHKRYTAFIHVSRQVYIDVVYLLYQDLTFEFSSFYSAELYLKVINPIKVRFITSIDLSISLSHKSDILSSSLVRTISTLKSLRQLTLQLRIDHTVFDEGPICNVCGHNHCSTDLPLLAEILEEWKNAKWEFLRGFESLSKLDMIIMPKNGCVYFVEDSPELQSFVAKVISVSGVIVSLAINNW